MEKVELVNLEDKGIKMNYEIMDNGECRYRLLKNDGTGYIRVEASESSGWQNSHYHKGLIETFIIQKGWMAIAILENNELSIRILKENEVYTMYPNIAHNCYLPKYAQNHTVKHGKAETGDWYASEQLDELVKGLSETDILEYSKRSK